MPIANTGKVTSCYDNHNLSNLRICHNKKSANCPRPTSRLTPGVVIGCVSRTVLLLYLNLLYIDHKRVWWDVLSTSQCLLKFICYPHCYVTLVNFTNVDYCTKCQLSFCLFNQQYVKYLIKKPPLTNYKN